MNTGNKRCREIPSNSLQNAAAGARSCRLSRDAGKGRDITGKLTAFSHVTNQTTITTAIENISSSDARTERTPPLPAHGS